MVRELVWVEEAGAGRSDGGRSETGKRAEEGRRVKVRLPLECGSGWEEGPGGWEETWEGWEWILGSSPEIERKVSRLVFSFS